MVRPRKVHTVESLLDNTIEEGGCLLWQGMMINRTPRVYSPEAGGYVSVRGMLSRLLGIERPDGGQWGTRCGVAGCVAPEHIQWRTMKSHSKYMRKVLQTMPASETLRRAKIAASKDRKVTDEMRMIIMSSNASSRAVAKELGVCKTTVAKYRRGGAQMVGNPFAGLMR
jgi:hypothetical protein